MKIAMIASSVLALIILNIVILTFVRYSANFKFSRTLIIVGSIIYITGLSFSFKNLFIVGQNSILIGIAFGVYGLFKKNNSNSPVFAFSISFIFLEFIAHFFDIKIIMFSYNLSGISISTIISVLIPLGVGFLTNLLLSKKGS